LINAIEWGRLGQQRARCGRTGRRGMATEIGMVRRQIGAGLRRVADALGVSQLALARQMGISGPSVNVWMSGEARLPLERLPEIAAALSRASGVSVAVDLLLYEMALTDRDPERSLESLVVERLGKQRENIRQNMQGAVGETPTPDVVLATEAARKRGRMPYSAAGSASYAYSHG
jgi:transcriptional regulator with XRE-family HTH domain